MDVSVQCVDPVKENLISTKDWGKIWSNCKQGSSTISSLVVELGSALEDALVLLSTSVPSVGRSEICHLEKEEVDRDLTIDQDESFTVQSTKELGEHAVEPRSRNMLLHDVPGSVKEKILKAELDDRSTLESDNPNSSSIVCLPVPFKLVSALKGSREKQGLHVGKLSVSWAPDVYDPPITSESHTVKSYRHLSRKSYGYGSSHNGKSTRSCDKKQHRKSSRSLSSSSRVSRR